MSVQNSSNRKNVPHLRGGIPRPKRSKRLGTISSPYLWGCPFDDLTALFQSSPHLWGWSLYSPRAVLFIPRICGGVPLCELLGYEEPIFSHVRGSGPSDHRFDRHQES